MKKISILGSTGSIGVSTLEVIRRHPDRFQVVGLTAGSNMELLARQIRETKPRWVSVKGTQDALQLKKFLKDGKPEILVGVEGAVAVATAQEADTVVSAIVGAAGLEPTLRALQAGKRVGLANKESMVIAGELMCREAKKGQAVLLPIDSEHSALFQCLNGNRKTDVRRLILTASGGPFRSRPASAFGTITVSQALAHPNWSMGAKITIDSATMMNKGLEVMEAHWLFDMPLEKIDICVHPQSIVHSLVEYCDGSVMAQMGQPDMKIPIAYALAYPERVETGLPPLDLFQVKSLTFEAPDFEKFRSLKTAFEVAKRGQTYPAVLNAANEIAVDAFLKGEISFNTIFSVNEKTVESHKGVDISSLEDILEADQWARTYSLSLVERMAA